MLGNLSTIASALSSYDKIRLSSTPEELQPVLELVFGKDADAQSGFFAKRFLDMAQQYASSGELTLKGFVDEGGMMKLMSALLNQGAAAPEDVATVIACPHCGETIVF